MKLGGYMLIPEDVIERVREYNDIVDVISESIPLKKKGKNYVGLCPFHNEKTPSFMVNQDKQIYHCFGCGEGGNVISFVMKYRNLGFVDAVIMLAERANVIIPDKSANIDDSKIKLKKELYNLNKETARYFYYNLHNKKNLNALDYFRNRGINSDIINKFGLGFSLDSWDSLYKYLTSKGFKPELIEKSGLIIKKETSGYYDRFRNRVMFPVIDVRGRVIGFGGRVLDDSKPKYLNSPETIIFNKGYNLYGLNIVSKINTDRKIIIVEGYMDAIALHQYGISNVVASLGTALTINQAKLLKRYCDEVYICYDSDSAGREATLRGLDILTNAGCDVKIVNLPRSKDPDEFIRSEGEEAFLKAVKKAMPLTEYVIRRSSEGYDLSTTEGKIGFIKSSAEALAQINDPIIVDAYAVKLSAETGISSSALYEEIKRIKANDDKQKYISGNNRYNNRIDGQKLYLEPAYLKAERSILHVIWENRECFDAIEKKLSWEDFNDDIYRKVANAIYKDIKQGKDVNPASIINMFDTTEAMAKVTQIFETNVKYNTNLDEMIDDYIGLINKHRLQSRKKQITTQARECDEKGDIEASAKLLNELMEIEKKLRTF